MVDWFYNKASVKQKASRPNCRRGSARVYLVASASDTHLGLSVGLSGRYSKRTKVERLYLELSESFYHRDTEM